VPQRERPVPHVAQTPAAQVPPVPQRLRQVPQLAGSVIVSVQVPLQAACVPGQLQMPLMQLVPVVQWTLQLPQFTGSAWTSMHAPPHAPMPAGHSTWQVPLRHTSFAAHAFAHVPQCSWLEPTSKHSPSQPSMGAMQSQRPMAQLVPLGQTLPQLPQF
jgi:hypothetical protein